MIARKLDSDYTVTKRLIGAMAKKIVRESVASQRLNTTPRSNTFVKNYTFGRGGGPRGFEGGGSPSTGFTTALVYDPAGSGQAINATRARIAGEQGLYMRDNAEDQTIRIVADAVNDPMWWLGV